MSWVSGTLTLHPSPVTLTPILRSGVSSCQDKMLVMKVCAVPLTLPHPPQVLVVLHVASYVASWFSMCSLAYLSELSPSPHLRRAQNPFG
jgi:hypothetical protein